MVIITDDPGDCAQEISEGCLREEEEGAGQAHFLWRPPCFPAPCVSYCQTFSPQAPHGRARELHRESAEGPVSLAVEE